MQEKRREKKRRTRDNNSQTRERMGKHKMYIPDTITYNKLCVLHDILYFTILYTVHEKLEQHIPVYDTVYQVSCIIRSGFHSTIWKNHAYVTQIGYTPSLFYQMWWKLLLHTPKYAPHREGNPPMWLATSEMVSYRGLWPESPGRALRPGGL